MRIVNSYPPPVSLQILNYNSFTKTPNLRNLTNLLNSRCLCITQDMSTFIDQLFGHVIAGDLNIVWGKSFYDIMSKGTKFWNGEKVNKPQVYN